MHCQYCGSEIPEEGESCPKCGKPTAGQTPDVPHQSQNGKNQNAITSNSDNDAESEAQKEADAGQTEQGTPQEDVCPAKDNVSTDSPSPNGDDGATSSESPTGDAAKQQKEDDRSASKHRAKRSFVFLAKWIGIYATALFALFIVAIVISGFAAPSTLYAKSLTLVADCLIGAIPYSIIVIALAIAGEKRRSRIQDAVKKITGKKPAIFKGLAVAGILALLAILFVNAECHHDYASATCTSPKICKVCGESEGEALGHDWASATCTEPKTCSRCGATEGKPKGHTPGDWEKGSTDYTSAKVTNIQKCSACGEKVNSKQDDLTSFVSVSTFSIPANDFIKRMGSAYSSISGCSLKAEKGSTSSGSLSLDVKSGSKTIARAGFVLTGSDNSLISPASGNAENIYWQIFFSISSSSSSNKYVAETMYALIQACDPSLTSDEAHNIGTEVLDNFETLSSSAGIGQASKNGITYTLAYSKSWIVSAKIG